MKPTIKIMPFIVVDAQFINFISKPEALEVEVLRIVVCISIKKLSGSFIASCMAVTLSICTINNESYNQNNKILLFLFVMYES